MKLVGLALGLLVASCGGATPQALSPADIPAAFIALSQAADRTMHMDWTGTYAMGELDAQTSRTHAILDFAGDDFAGSFSAEATFGPEGKPGGAMLIELASVDGVTYQRLENSGGQWQRGEPLPRSLDPMRGLTAGNIDYGGRAAGEGAENLHVLRVKDVSYLTDLMTNGLGIGIDGGNTNYDEASSSFEIFVDDTARPIKATLLLATNANPDAFGTISLTSTYEFSNWNAEIYIVAPN